MLCLLALRTFKMEWHMRFVGDLLKILDWEASLLQPLSDKSHYTPGGDWIRIDRCISDVYKT